MIHPVRIQLSRKKGFNLQATSLALNGLPAVKVDRSTKWGNPFVNSDAIRGKAADYFRDWIQNSREGIKVAESARRELRGKNLARWCSLTSSDSTRCSCHAAVLLEFANELETGMNRIDLARMMEKQ